MCDLVAELKPNVVSFHFGLPEKKLFARIRATGAKILSSATTVDEARWLEAQGFDAIVAQGFEAGGHRGMSLTDDISAQIGTLSLVPQVVDSVKVPVIAAGGIADARGIGAAFALGAATVQRYTAYLPLPGSQDQLIVPARAEKRRESNSAHECIHRAACTDDGYAHGSGDRPNIAYSGDVNRAFRRI